MVTITAEDGKAIFEVEGDHKLWAVKSRIEIPLAHIKKIYVDPNPAMGWFDAIKISGTALPHIFRAGTFWSHGEWIFFDVRHPEKTIVVELENEHYAKLVVEVENPEAAVKMLEGAIE